MNSGLALGVSRQDHVRLGMHIIGGGQAKSSNLQNFPESTMKAMEPKAGKLESGDQAS